MATLTVGQVAPAPIEEKKSQSPQANFIGGYVYFRGSINATLPDRVENMLAMLVTALSKKIWDSIEIKEREDLIARKRFVYIKCNDGHPTEIGVHMSTIKEIQESGLTRIVLGEILLPTDFLVRAIPESSYQNMVKRLTPK